MTWKTWGNQYVVTIIAKTVSVCGIAAICGTVYGEIKPDRTAASATQLSASIPTAKINQPTNGRSVDRSIAATGTLTSLAAGDSLWIYVYPLAEKRYYPSKVTYNAKTKIWQTNLVVGSTNQKESGASFKIGLFTANSKLSNELNQSKDRGVSKIPAGISQLVSLAVQRK
jgi:hypothetical protein